MFCRTGVALETCTTRTGARRSRYAVGMHGEAKWIGTLVIIYYVGDGDINPNHPNQIDFVAYLRLAMFNQRKICSKPPHMVWSRMIIRDKWIWPQKWIDTIPKGKGFHWLHHKLDLMQKIGLLRLKSIEYLIITCLFNSLWISFLLLGMCEGRCLNRMQLDSPASTGWQRETVQSSRQLCAEVRRTSRHDWDAQTAEGADTVHDWSNFPQFDFDQLHQATDVYTYRII